MHIEYISILSSAAPPFGIKIDAPLRRVYKFSQNLFLCIPDLKTFQTRCHMCILNEFYFLHDRPVAKKGR